MAVAVQGSTRNRQVNQEREESDIDKVLKVMQGIGSLTGTAVNISNLLAAKQEYDIKKDASDFKKKGGLSKEQEMSAMSQGYDSVARDPNDSALVNYVNAQGEEKAFRRSLTSKKNDLKAVYDPARKLKVYAPETPGYAFTGKEQIADQGDMPEKLRGEYSREGITQRTQSVLEAHEFAKNIMAKPQTNGSDDYALVVTYAKILDPSTGVKEGEVQAAGSNDSIKNKADLLWQKLTAGSNNRLTDQAKRDIWSAIQQRTKAQLDVQAAVDERYTQLAGHERYGVDPLLVVNPAYGKLRDALSRGVVPPRPKTKTGLPSRGDLE